MRYEELKTATEVIESAKQGKSPEFTDPGERGKWFRSIFTREEDLNYIEYCMATLGTRYRILIGE